MSFITYFLGRCDDSPTTQTVTHKQSSEVTNHGSAQVSFRQASEVLQIIHGRPLRLSWVPKAVRKQTIEAPKVGRTPQRLRQASWLRYVSCGFDGFNLRLRLLPVLPFLSLKYLHIDTHCLFDIQGSLPSET